MWVGIFVLISERFNSAQSQRARRDKNSTILGGWMMSFNYIGHMAVEAEEALKDQTVRISAQNIFLFTAFNRFKGIFGSL